MSTNAAQQPRNEGAIKAGNGKMTGGPRQYGARDTFPARHEAHTVRLAEPSEVVAMVKLLCSSRGRYITGQTVHVNGGFYMNS